MVALMVISVDQHGERVALTLGGCRRDELRSAALRLCARRFGPSDWHIADERFRPTMTSRTGAVRLWEGRFEVTHS